MEETANQKATALILSVLEISHAAPGMPSVSPCAEAVLDLGLHF